MTNQYPVFVKSVQILRIQKLPTIEGSCFLGPPLAHQSPSDIAAGARDVWPVNITSSTSHLWLYRDLKRAYFMQCKQKNVLTFLFLRKQYPLKSQSYLCVYITSINCILRPEQNIISNNVKEVQSQQKMISYKC